MSYKYSSFRLCLFAIILSFVIFLPLQIFAQIPTPSYDSGDEHTAPAPATPVVNAFDSTEFPKLQKEISQIKIELEKKRDKFEPFSLQTSILQFGPFALIVLIFGLIFCLWKLIDDLHNSLVKADNTIKRIRQSIVTINEQLDPLHLKYLLDKPNKAIFNTDFRISSIDKQLESLSKRIADVVLLTNAKPPLHSPIGAPSAHSLDEQNYESLAPLKQPELLLPSLHEQVIEAFGKSQIFFDSSQFQAMRDANAQNGRVNEEGVKALELISAQRSEAGYLLFSDNNDHWLIPNVFHSRLTQQISQMKVENSNVFDVEVLVGTLVLVRAAKVQKIDGNEYNVLAKGLIHF